MKRESHTVDRSHQVDSSAQRHLPLVDLLVDTRTELLELAVASGLKVLTTMLEEDRTAICGLAINIKRIVRPRAPAPCRARSSSVVGRSRSAARGSVRTARKCRCRRFS